MISRSSGRSGIDVILIIHVDIIYNSIIPFDLPILAWMIYFMDELKYLKSITLL